MMPVGSTWHTFSDPKLLTSSRSLEGSSIETSPRAPPHSTLLSSSSFPRHLLLLLLFLPSSSHLNTTPLPLHSHFLLITFFLFIKKEKIMLSRFFELSSMISALKFQVCSGKHGMFSLSVLLLFLCHLNPVAAQLSPPDPFQSPRFNPSMAIIVIVLIAAMFFMAFFAVYIRHCSDSNSAGSVRPLAVLSRRLAAARGLDKSAIEKFPTFVYSDVKGLKIGKGALECAVCLCEFEDDETLRLIPKCDHVFHPDCIDAWLASHTTCPVCRANLTPQPEDESSPPGQLNEPSRQENDIESQNDAVQSDHEDATATENAGSALPAPDQQVIPVQESLKRNRTRGSSRSGISLVKFLRSHSTGHSVVQPGENTERFTLRLPAEVRKQILNNRKLNRATSMVVLPGEASSRRGYRTGGDGGSSRGKANSYRRIDQPERLTVKSDRWVFLRTPSFFSRASSFKSPRVAANDGEGISTVLNESGAQSSDPGRLPV